MIIDRELDVLIAQYVFNITVILSEDAKPVDVLTGVEIPFYLSNQKLIIDGMATKGYTFTLGTQSKSSKWECSFHKDPLDRNFHSGENVTRAIAYAALAALDYYL